MKEDIEKILSISVSAPSGENCQPWKFVVTGDRVDIFNIPEKDLSLYNFKQRGSLIAHGALIENIVISASQLGYSTQVILLGKSSENHISTIVFSETSPSKERLFDSIKKRTSNRFPYKKTPLSGPEIETLRKSLPSDSRNLVFFVNDKNRIKKIAKALTVSDQILFENQEIHDFLFEHIIWNEEEAKAKKSGFYIKELGLPPPIEKIFRFLRKWNRVKIFNKFGFSKMAAKGNVRLYASSGAMVAVAVESDDPASFINAGRLTQRIWLESTNMGLVAQPVTGVIFFMQRVGEGAGGEFSEDHKRMVKDAYKEISEIFGPTDKTLSMLLRIGYPTKDAPKSLRLPPDIKYT